MRRTQTTRINIFLLLLFYIKNIYFVRKHIWKNLVFIAKIVLKFFRVADNWKCSNKIPTVMWICLGLVDASLGPKILCNRLGILT